MTALRRGLHVFLFSDNVALDDEIALKQLAVSRRLLCMGPDCGTAYLNGVGLGFAKCGPEGPGRLRRRVGDGAAGRACQLAASARASRTHRRRRARSIRRSAGR